MTSYRVLGEAGRVLEPRTRAGFDTLPDQFVNRQRKRGFRFNLAVLGETAIGKSSLIDSLFNQDFEQRPHSHEELPGLEQTTRVLREGGVHLTVRITSSVGYGDQLDRTDSYKPLLDFIKNQHDAYLQEELRTNRNLSAYEDTRVHACIVMLSPTGTLLKSIDLAALKDLSECVNVIPVIAKVDSITHAELDDFKRLLRAELVKNGINVFQPESVPVQYPLGVVASQTKLKVQGETMRVRQYPWGIVEVENEEHSDFVHLRNLMLRTHLEALESSTHAVHYHAYRASKLSTLSGGEGADEPSSVTQLLQKRSDEIDREIELRQQRMKEDLQSLVDGYNKDVLAQNDLLKEKKARLQKMFEEEQAKFERDQNQLALQKRAFEQQKEQDLREQQEDEEKKKDKKKDKKKKKSLEP